MSKLFKSNESNNLFINFGKSMNAIFQPNDYVKKYLKCIDTNKKLLGITVRRGDVRNVMKDFDKAKPLEEYVKYIKKFDCNEYDIYVSSDSIDIVINELKELLPEYTYHYSDYSDLEFIPSNGIDMEGFLQKNTKYIETVVISAIIDLHGLSQCDAFIGPYIKSVFSTVALFLMIGNKGIIPVIDICNPDCDMDELLSKIEIMDSSLQ